MLMTSNKLTARAITPIGDELLAIIRQAGANGIDRAALASKTGKRSLNRWQLAQLDLLMERGQIAMTTRPTARPHILEFVYTVKG